MNDKTERRRKTTTTLSTSLRIFKIKNKKRTVV